MKEVPVNKKVRKWEHIYDTHKQNQLINPFSRWEGASHRDKLPTDHIEYGTPITGSGTEKNAKFAGKLISRETKLLVNVIETRGHLTERGEIGISFGQLFEIFERLSNKVVGLLLIARRHGLIDFDGEMLFQRRDEHKIIYLKQSLSEEGPIKLKFVQPFKTKEN